jgi:poly-gamma-glutamate capsule biosynthesis protein CapA/YwtB (metallophosphatase superfamily)
MDRRTFLKTVSQAAAVAAASRLVPGAAGRPDAAEALPRKATLVAVGDCLISRHVSGLRDPDFLAVAELLRGADATWGNCELVLADVRELYPAQKGQDPHGIAPPWGADELKWMGIGFVGTANNHILDFGNEGLFATLKNLERVGIPSAGSGANLEEASRFGLFDSSIGRVAQVSCASTFPSYFAASPSHPYLRGRPGLNPLRVDVRIQLPEKTFEAVKAASGTVNELMGLYEFGDMTKDLEAKLPKDTTYLYDTTVAKGDKVDVLSQANPGDVQRITEAIRMARNNARFVIATIHAHEARHKLEIPDPFLPVFAHACIDAGADAFFASGPHVPRGVEIYKGKPVFYSLGNFFFQYETIQPVPPEAFAGMGLDSRSLDPSLFYRKIPYGTEERFWHSFVPRLTFEGDAVAGVELFPITLGFSEPAHDRGIPRLARGDEARKILEKIATLSKLYGTTLDIDGEVGHIRMPPAQAKPAKTG